MRVTPSAANSSNALSQPISQSTAITLIVLILGASFYLWRTRYLRSRAAMIAIAGVVAMLAYLAFFSNPYLAS